MWRWLNTTCINAYVRITAMDNFLQRSSISSWNTLTSVVSAVVFKGVLTYRFANSDKHFLCIPGGALHVHLSWRSPQQGRSFRCGVECSEALAFFFLMLWSTFFPFLACCTADRRFCFFCSARHFCFRCLSFRLTTWVGAMLRNRHGFFMANGPACSEAPRLAATWKHERLCLSWAIAALKCWEIKRCNLDYGRCGMFLSWNDLNTF